MFATRAILDLMAALALAVELEHTRTWLGRRSAKPALLTPTPMLRALLSLIALAILVSTVPTVALARAAPLVNTKRCKVMSVIVLVAHLTPTARLPRTS